ncbi:MAG: PHP domain-containing protein, partial [Traorella sp.]
MRVDFHIHSALSPCASDDMTPNNIINMAKICELDCISVCDHNTLGQQRIMKQVADKLGMRYIYGVEVQSNEDVHICAYFNQFENVQLFQEYLKKHLLPIENDLHYFGNQYLFNENDEIIGQEKVLLIQSIEKSINEI